MQKIQFRLRGREVSREEHDTVTMMYMYGSYVLIGLASVLIGVTASPSGLMWAGLIYFALGPVSAVIGYRRGSQRHNLQVQLAQTMPNSRQTDAVPSVAAVGPNLSEAMPANNPDTAIVNVTNP